MHGRQISPLITLKKYFNHMRKIKIITSFCLITFSFLVGCLEVKAQDVNLNDSIYHIFDSDNFKKYDKLIEGPMVISEINSNFKRLSKYMEIEDSFDIFYIAFKSNNAISISITLNDFDLDKNDTLRVLNVDGEVKIFFCQEELNNRQFHLNTPKLNGDSYILVFKKYRNNFKSGFNIVRLNHFIVSINDLIEASPISGFGNSGNCQVDVKCSPESDQYTKEINSVCRLIVDDRFFCSAAVINNTSSNGLPYVLSANHCFDDKSALPEGPAAAAANTEFLFNYDSPNCNGPNGSLMDTLMNADLIAQAIQQDAILLRTKSQIPTTFNVYYSGWDKNVFNQPPNGVGIHHPRGDVKKIATHNLIPQESICMSAPWNHFHSQNIVFNNFDFWLIDWIPTPNGHSVTEGGSSGSPLYNSNKRIIGQLFGSGLCNNKNCINPFDDFANYGILGNSWYGNGFPNGRLSDWLDPLNLGSIEHFGLRIIRDHYINYDKWVTGDIVKFFNVEVEPGREVVVTELQDRFKANGTLKIPVGATFKVYKP